MPQGGPTLSRRHGCMPRYGVKLEKAFPFGVYQIDQIGQDPREAAHQRAELRGLSALHHRA